MVVDRVDVLLHLVLVVMAPLLPMLDLPMLLPMLDLLLFLLLLLQLNKGKEELPKAPIHRVKLLK